MPPKKVKKASKAKKVMSPSPRRRGESPRTPQFMESIRFPMPHPSAAKNAVIAASKTEPRDVVRVSLPHSSKKGFCIACVGRLAKFPDCVCIVGGARNKCDRCSRMKKPCQWVGFL